MRNVSTEAHAEVCKVLTNESTEVNSVSIKCPLRYTEFQSNDHCSTWSSMKEPIKLQNYKCSDEESTEEQ